MGGQMLAGSLALNLTPSFGHCQKEKNAVAAAVVGIGSPAVVLETCSTVLSCA